MKQSKVNGRTNSKKLNCNKSFGSLYKFLKSRSLLFNCILYFISLQTVKADLQQNSSKKPVKQPQKTSVCYKNLGCYNFTSGPHRGMSIPESPEKLQTRFLLKTRNSTLQDVTDVENLKSSTFNASRPTKFVIHGFQPITTLVLPPPKLPEWVFRMTDAILSADDANVFVVNWTVGASQIVLNYQQALTNTLVVGHQLFNLLQHLKETYNINEKDIHLIGFSLGAHLAGHTGKLMKKAGTKIARISGVDPASFMYNEKNPDAMLQIDDADFVDVIHSNMVEGGGLKHFGHHAHIGHVDFWPDGGDKHPQCDKKGSSMACDHSAGHEFYTESILHKSRYLAYRCPNYQTYKKGSCFNCRTRVNNILRNNRCRYMGYYATPLSGKPRIRDFYLSTTEKSPFVGNTYRVQVSLRDNLQDVRAWQNIRCQFMMSFKGTEGSSEIKNLEFHQPEKRYCDECTNHHTTEIFVVTLPERIGELKQVSFAWKNLYNDSSAWWYYAKMDVTLRIKRIKVFDATSQKRYAFGPERDTKRFKRAEMVVKPGTKYTFNRILKHKKKTTKTV